MQFGRAFVQIPVFAPCDERVVGVGEGNGQAPRARIKAARQVVDFLHGLVGHIVVIFQLIGNLGHARAGDRAKVVIPPINPLTWFAVIWGPAEIGGVNVGRQALFKAVQLVWTDKVHLARQGGLIPRAAQMVGIGRDVRGKLCRVVIHPCAAWQSA